jgi:hypothetical protein
MLGFTPLSQSPFSAPSVAANIIEASASASAASSVALFAIRERSTAASDSSASSASSACHRVREDAQSVSAASSTAISYEAVHFSGGLIPALSIVSSGVERVREDAQQVSASSSSNFDSELSRVRTATQVMSSASSATATPYVTRNVSGLTAGASVVTTIVARVRLIEIDVSGQASLSGDVDRVRLTSGISGSATSSTSCRAVATFSGSSQISALASNSLKPTRIRDLNKPRPVTAVSTVIAEAREKWETLTTIDVDDFWTEQPAPSSSSSFWTKVA